MLRCISIKSIVMIQRRSYWGEEWAGEWQHGRSVYPLSVFNPPRAATAIKQSCRVESIQHGSIIKSTHLQHVKKSGLSGVVETKEKQLCVLVKQSQGGQHIVDYTQHVSAHPFNKSQAVHCEQIHTPVDDPHNDDVLVLVRIKRRGCL